MTKRKGAIIPDPVNPTGTYRRVLCIPASPDWIALVTGALYVLTQAWYWDEQTGDVDAVVERAKQMYFEYQDQSGDCDVSDMWLPGAIQMWAGLDTPGDGWLECNGQSLLRADYPDLFASLGTQWGAADGTHFNIPDYRSRSPMGQGKLDGEDPNPLYQLGWKIGELDHELTVDELAEHGHVMASSNFGSFREQFSGSAVAVNNVPYTPATTFPEGDGVPHNTVHPVSICRFFIYAGV